LTFPLIQLPRKSEVDGQQTTIELLKKVSINSTSEEVRSFFNRRTLMRERLQFPLIQLPRKSEDLYPVFQSTENVSINSTSEEVRREKIQPCC